MTIAGLNLRALCSLGKCGLHFPGPKVRGMLGEAGKDVA